MHWISSLTNHCKIFWIGKRSERGGEAEKEQEIKERRRKEINRMKKRRERETKTAFKATLKCQKYQIEI